MNSDLAVHAGKTLLKKTYANIFLIKCIPAYENGQGYVFCREGEKLYFRYGPYSSTVLT